MVLLATPMLCAALSTEILCFLSNSRYVIKLTVA